MNTMTQKLMSAFWAIVLTWAVCSMVYAGHTRNNGSCEDDKTHYNNMVNKRSDAPLWEQSKAMYELALQETVAWQCEEKIEEALRMIRKPYPSE